MIDLTVKTLDSQNHAFSVPDDTTVKQLKEKIAESISFPVDSQRLIYCGRVLQDDKNLSEYDVNGKVIHLVQRPPPAARPNGSPSSARTVTGPSRRANHHFRQSRLDGNAMYLGAMAFPADLMDAQGIQAPPASHNLSLSRLVLARRMLRRAASTLTRLENPPSAQEATDTDSPPEESDNASSSNGENGANSSTSAGPTVVPFSGSIAQAAQAATAAAIAAAVSAAHAASVSNITIVQGGDTPGDVPIEDSEVTISTSDGAASADTPMQDAASPPETQPATQEARSGTVTIATGENRPRSQEPPRTSTMAELLDDLNAVNRRLQPFLAQYHQLMRDDPIFAPHGAPVRDAQRVFGLVSEVMHYLSHAYHALSDAMCDFSQPPPRLLRCRPVLIQHSAVLQAGIPIQAQINVMANRNLNSSTNTNDTEQENSSRSTANGPTSTETPAESTPAPATTTSSQAESNQTQGSAQEQRPRAQGQEATFNIAPGNVEFFMEVGPGSITIDSLEATVVTNGNASGVGNGGVEANVVGGGFPWANPPPPEFIQNLMHAVAGHMISRGGGTQNGNPPAQAATSSSATTTVTAGGAGGGGGTATGQNSQARVNTATHPTTATQTRSTSRPHVHLAPAMQRRARLRRGRRIHFHVMDGSDFDSPPGLAASNFDPFLPCNSHHIRSRSRHNIHPFQQHFIANLESQTPSAASSAAASQGEETRSTTPPGPPPEQNTASTQPRAPEQPACPQEPTSQPPPSSQPQQQASPQQPSGQQDARPPTEQVQNLFDIISTLFNNLPPSSGGASISFGPFAHMMPPRSPSSNSPRSATASSAGAASSSPPPGMAFFMNMPNGQGSAGVGDNPFNMPMMAQMFEGLTGALSGALQGQGQGQGNTIADFLQSLPENSYTEGSSLFMDLMMTLARSLTFQDIIALSFGNTDALHLIRPRLRAFVAERLLQNESMNSDTVTRGVDRLIREIRPFLDVMLQARLREDVDLITTTIRYNQIRLPQAVQLIMAGGNESTFGGHMVQWCTIYIRELTAIIRHCCLDDMQGINLMIRNYVQQLTSGIHPAVQQWTVNSSLANLRNFISNQNVPLEDIQQFLVYRIASASPAAEPAEEPTPPEPASEEPNPEPMEMDTSSGEPQATPPTIQAERISSPISMDSETLPDVVLGSESWHNVLPSDWVPIITRDTQRQRRQSSQAPFSDAYLSGMPSKRRKIVTAAKPQGNNMNQVVTESVRRSIEDAGVRPVAGVEFAGEDMEVQAAYREQMRSSVERSLASSSDFTPERFPNATKYFSK